MTYSREQIEKAVKEKGYIWFDGDKDFNVNIIGIRNNSPTVADRVTNVFDDWMTLSFKEGGVWKFYEWYITTDPGTKAVKAFHNPNGVARVVPGQYRGMWAVGLHQGKYEAMRQIKPVKVYRDKNRDMTFNETVIQEGIFGINGHRSNPTTESMYVENWSEGCQVFKRIKDFNEFMRLVNKAKLLHGNSFTYTLIESTDLVLKKKPKLMLLKNGSKGEDVKKLQAKLGLTADGAFGPRTEAKVKAWQAANGLTADGIVGDATWTKLFGAAPVAAAPVAIPASDFKLSALKGHIPDSVIAQIPSTAAKFNITNTLRLAHFLAQCGHESGGFKAVRENLNYSADGLKKIFPKYFPGKLNESYARQPEKIAARVYGGRMGNGDESTKEGFKFRGRGYIQLTGKSNYTLFDKFVDDDILANPDLVSTKYPLASAAWFFNNNKLWSICDQGATDGVVTSVTKRVNGGTNGLADRIKHFKEYYALLK